MEEQVEALRRSSHRAAAEDRKRAASPPESKPSTLQRGEGRPRRGEMESRICQHPHLTIPGISCMRPALCRGPLSGVISCPAHYHREYRRIQKRDPSASLGDR
jgi:hypothetical protein